MVKLIGSVLIIISFSIFGITASIRQKKRCESLKLLIRCTRHIGTEALYSKKRCELILKEAYEAFGIPLLRDACTMICGHGINTAFRKALELNKDTMALKDSDVIAASGIASIFSNLPDEQSKSTDSVIKLLELAFNDAENNYTKNSKLYKSGSILCGILTAVLLF